MAVVPLIQRALMEQGPRASTLNLLVHVGYHSAGSHQAIVAVSGLFRAHPARPGDNTTGLDDEVEVVNVGVVLVLVVFRYKLEL